ncbi:hypothetical protein [Bdellovibrio sp. HCB337]|uniref:hypothetical protein n=1 Tax=Bdellovibrio sp. HCB337 TaxID=3394358 RepID=UPI0039A6C249
MSETTMSTLNKAHRINLNTSIYGTFAEIGAGQEVARHFFLAGKASQTVAKTISAYDMTFSDEIYGREKTGRYVCESRLEKMLTHEFTLLVERLSKKRGTDTRFFAFANTVATGSANDKKYCHGWMGVRFQKNPQGAYNDIILHVRMQDRHRLQQQEALGILGVNLVDAAFHHTEDYEDLISCLVDNLKEGQIIIDVLHFQGEDLKHLNPHLTNLELVRRGLAEAVLFGPQKEILHVPDTVYKKAVLLQRGTYRPVTKTHLDVLSKGLNHFKKDFQLKDEQCLSIMELTMRNLLTEGEVNDKDFLDRIETLCSLGQHVLVSNFYYFYPLKTYFRQYTQEPMAIVVGASHLERVFDESRYKDLSGGILEGLGKLLDAKTKLYVYPHKTDMTCMTAKSFFPTPSVKHLYSHFKESNQVCDIAGCDETEVYTHSDQVHQMILKKDPQWETLVPTGVRDLIRTKKLFGYN